MPVHGSIRLSPIDKQAGEQVRGSSLPLAVLLALNSSEGSQAGSESAEQCLAAPPEAAPLEQAAAIFSQDDNCPAPAVFVADTAFDCEEGNGSADWPSNED